MGGYPARSAGGEASRASGEEVFWAELAFLPTCLLPILGHLGSDPDPHEAEGVVSWSLGGLEKKSPKVLPEEL